MKVIIAGGREFNNLDLLIEKCDLILSERDCVEIVSGCARGADKLGEHYAKQRGFAIKEFPADWGKYGKSAGYKRNSEMADYSDALIAFWDGESKGTKHMIDLATKNKLEIHVIRY